MPELQPRSIETGRPSGNKQKRGKKKKSAKPHKPGANLVGSHSPSVPFPNPLTFGVELDVPLSAHETVLKGLPYSSYLQFVKASNFSRAEISKVASIPERSIDRRRKAKWFKPNESDRLLRFAKLFQAVRELFEGDNEAARKWMHAPRSALGGRTPLELAATDVGSRQVETLVQQLEHGVFV